MENLIFSPVVMAGGVGSRLWPLSRASYPKQFQCLINPESGLSMLQQTIARLDGLNIQHGQVICNQDHRFLAAEQVRQIGGRDCHAALAMTGVEQLAMTGVERLAMTESFDIVLEPMGRNTAPAVLVAALRLLDKGVDAPMLLLAADHAIADVEAFQLALVEAHELAASGIIVTLGIKPTFACTGYGYIRQGTKLTKGYVVDTFVEKPNVTLANKYISSGDYLWNSGMFIANPSTLVAEAKKYCPELLVQCKKVVESSYADLDFVRLPEELFSQCEDISIDYAIMEHTQHAAVVPMDCGWSDVGDLGSLKEANSNLADTSGNVIDGDVEIEGSTNCFVKPDGKLVALLGVHNLAVIDTKDALLVADLSKSQDVKKIVNNLKSRQELDHHREVFRPWGSYDSVDNGHNYQVKRITVNPGAKLSLQRHQHRAEHWVVVDGTATVHLDGAEHLLQANESIFIPKQAVHSLANQTELPLHLIEVQSGSYLGEDDIERLEDLYGREGDKE